MPKLHLSLLAVLSLAFASAFGQGPELWTLERCLETASQNAPIATQAKLTQELADWDLKTAKSQRLPSISASSGLGMQLGYTIDPTTNTFDNQQIGYNGINLNAEMTLFAGGSVHQNIKAERYQQQSTTWQQQEVINQLKLRVLIAYMNALMGAEQVQQASLEEASLQAQRDNIKRQIESGTRSANDRLELEVQLAQNRRLIVQAQQQVALAEAELRFLLALDQDAPLRLAPWEDTDNSPLLESGPGFLLAHYPTIQDREAQLKAAEYRLKASRGNAMPQITLFGSLNTNYSSVSQKVVGFEVDNQSENVSFMGTEGTLVRFNESPIYAPNPYFNQLRENFGQQVGVFFSIPIFQQTRNHISVQRSKVDLLQAKVALQNERQQLSFTVQQAFIAQKTAYDNYETAQQAAAVNEQLLQNKEREFKLGSCNALDYFIVRNRSLNAQRQLISARYDYYYRSKVLELYERGEL
ncbi:MAG: TolC family protein [Bacteroidota bacterium]